jgi:hypothetical protein
MSTPSNAYDWRNRLAQKRRHKGRALLRKVNPAECWTRFRTVDGKVIVETRHLAHHLGNAAPDYPAPCDDYVHPTPAAELIGRVVERRYA